MLKVINIDSRVDLTKHDITFVEQVIEYAENDKRWMDKNHLSPFMEKIPVFLLGKDKMPELPDYLKDYKIPPIELLGFFTRLTTDRVYFKDIPVIFLCPENIKLLCKPQSLEEYQRILADVTIHEFAHAKMDNNGEQFNSLMKDHRKFFDSIEEPLANWYVLKYFFYYGNGDFFHEVETSIKKEPMYYKLGYDFFHSDIADGLWKDWKNKKSTIAQNTDIGDWLNKANEYINDRAHPFDIKSGLDNVLGLNNSK
jgi:hypothetical protein